MTPIEMLLEAAKDMDNVDYVEQLGPARVLVTFYDGKRLLLKVEAYA